MAMRIGIKLKVTALGAEFEFPVFVLGRTAAFAVNVASLNPAPALNAAKC